MFFVFHFEISGNSFNEQQQENRKRIFITFLVSYFEISGNVFSEEQ